MIKSKEVIFPEPLGEIVKNILQVAEEVGIRYPLTCRPDEIVSSLLNQKLSILYEKWKTSIPDGRNGWWRGFVKEFRRVQAAFPDGKVEPSSDPASYPEVVVLSLPYIPKRPLANEVLQRKFVRALGIPEDWQNLLTSRPPCTALSAWADGNRVFCSVTRDKGSLWIKSDGRRNTEEFLLLSSYPGVAAGLWFYPPTGKQGTPIEQLIPEGRAVVVTKALVSPDLLLGRSLNPLQTPASRDRFLEDLFRQFSKI